MSYEPPSDSERIADAVDGVRAAIDAIELPDVTLRDRFAIGILPALLGNTAFMAEFSKHFSAQQKDKELARLVYLWADEMLLAREGK